MSNAEQNTPNDTPVNSNTSKDSMDETEKPVTSRELQQDPFLSTSSSPTRTSSLTPFKVEGGNLKQIAENIAESISSNAPAETKEATLNFLQMNANGFVGGLAMRCKGADCPIVDVCPLQETNQSFPLGQPCPYEMGIVQMWVNKHLVSLGIEDFSSPENSFDMDILYELAAHELIKWKAAHHLSQVGKLVEDRKINVTMTGDTIFAEVMSPALEILDNHNKITMKLREALLATRKAQIQAGKDMADPSRKSADLAEKARKKAQERLKKIREKPEDIKDADFEVKDDK